MAFKCEYCGNRNTDYEPFNPLEEKGKKYTLKVIC